MEPYQHLTPRLALNLSVLAFGSTVEPPVGFGRPLAASTDPGWLSELATMYAPEPIDDPAPSYEETIGSAKLSVPRIFEEDKSAGQATFATQLSEVRQKRIDALVDMQILPLVSEHVETGISRATFAFILSNLSEHWRIADEQAMNLSHAGFTRLVRMQEDENTVQFWQQPSVLAQLDATLRKRLAISSPISTETPLSSSQRQAAEPPKKRWFWQRSKGPSESGPMFQQGDAGWRSPESDEVNTALRVNLREIGVRATTDMGLYQTVHCPAIVITSDLDAN